MSGCSCKHCNGKFSSKNSTNLKNHLRAKHPDVYEEVQLKDKNNSSALVAAEAELVVSMNMEEIEIKEEIDSSPGNLLSKQKIDYYEEGDALTNYLELEEKDDSVTSSHMDESENKSPGKRSSAVHEHFYQVKILHPKTSQPVKGSRCKYCDAKFSNRISSNLQTHLKVKHPEAYNEVICKKGQKRNGRFHVPNFG